MKTLKFITTITVSNKSKLLDQIDLKDFAKGVKGGLGFDAIMNETKPERIKVECKKI